MWQVFARILPMTLRLLAAAAALLLVASTASAQPVAAFASGPAASASSGSRGGMGGMGGHNGMSGRWGSGVTTGWSMMTPEERKEHQTRMQSMTNYADCKSYTDEHHQQMVKRAAENGRTAPAQPRRDACTGLKR